MDNVREAYGIYSHQLKSVRGQQSSVREDYRDDTPINFSPGTIVITTPLFLRSALKCLKNGLDDADTLPNFSLMHSYYYSFSFFGLPFKT